MGVVYRTVQPSLNKPLAIKILRFDEGTEGRVLARFNRELEIVAQLTHPNIVNVVSAGKDEPSNLHYVVMELVEGETLEEVLLENRMAPVLALEIISQVLSALSEPHNHGVIHRDVKPANVMVTIASDGKLLVKLLDFGIARKANVGEDAKITTTATVIGSPAYMSPEAVSGTDMDSQTDLYSLGICFYEMLTGQVPFTGTTPVAVMLRQAVEEPPEITEVLPEFDFPEIITLVKSLLEKEAADRPAGARVVIEEIERIMRMRGFVVGRFSTDMNVVQSLSRHLTPRKPVSATVATETWKAGGPSSPSFEGWMVSSEFLATLPDSAGIEVEEVPNVDASHTVTSDKSIAKTTSKAPVIIVGALLLTALLASLAWIAFNNNPPIELGSEKEVIEKVVVVPPKVEEKIEPVKELVKLTPEPGVVVEEPKIVESELPKVKKVPVKTKKKVKKTETKKEPVVKKVPVVKPPIEKKKSGGEEEVKKVEPKIDKKAKKAEDEKRIEESMEWLKNK